MSAQNYPMKIINSTILEALKEELEGMRLQYKIIKDSQGPGKDIYYVMYLPHDEHLIDEAISSAEFSMFQDDIFDTLEERNEMERAAVLGGLDAMMADAKKKTSRNETGSTALSLKRKIEVEGRFKDELASRLRDAGVFTYEWLEEGRGTFIRAEESEIKKIEAIYTGFLNEVKNQGRPKEVEKPSPTPVQRKKPGPKKMNRDIRYQVRFTEEEMKKVEERIRLSGKRKGDFAREMLLDGYVKTVTVNGLLAIQELQNLNSQLGKLTGAMVKIMQQTKDSPYLSAEDRAELQREINNSKKLRSDIRKQIKSVWK